MKKVLSLFVAIVMMMALACPAFAADAFVPSITYKGDPDIVIIKDNEGKSAIGKILDEGGNVVSFVYGDCLLITPLSEAKTSTKIPAAARDELLYVYDELKKGTMELPYEKVDGYNGEDMVIRELIDATWLCAGSTTVVDHEKMIEPEGVVFEITFKLGVKAGTKVIVMAYVDGAWNPIEKVVNNGDGTVTCTFEKICPIAFCVGESEYYKNPQTGDTSNLGLWVGMLVFSVAALVVVGVVYRRKTAK